MSPTLLEILACPVPECRAPLDAADSLLICRGCGLRYAITDGWPTLIPEEAVNAAGRAANPPEPEAQTP
ncbi:MAG: Trm112 family protein [Phycisphaerae bacterium]|nr:Trm112 family protein [Phycisphaerae bacterium]